MKSTSTMNQQVIDRIEEMCRVLRTNYQSYAIDQHRRAIERADVGDMSSIHYHEEEIGKLSSGEGVDEFVYEKGRKYAKIIHITNPGGYKSAHAFVDMKTGDVMKSASWKAPAKGVRYNLLDDNSREEMYKRADFAGGYLYAR